MQFVARVALLLAALAGLLIDAVGTDSAEAAPNAAAPNTAIPRGLSRVRVYGDVDGLHNLVVVSITQDRNGALWLATDDGAYRFDGEHFTPFGLEQGLPTTTTLVVGTTPEGGVCTGSRLGLVCFDGVRFSRAGAEGLPEETIYSLATWRRKMWVGTARGLFVREEGQPFQPAPGWPSDAPSPVVDAVWVDARGVVVGCGGAVYLSDGEGRWERLSAGLAGDRIDGVLRDPEGALWVRTAHHLWQIPMGSARAVDLGEGLPPAFDSADVATNMILGPRGEVWIGTDLGIVYRAADRWQFLGRGQGFAGARTLFIDREGTTWLGANGLFRWRGRGLIERFDPDNGTPGRVAWSFARDDDGVLWMGTDRCLARMLDERWQCLPGTTERVVRSFVFPPQGGVYAGGVPSELLYITPTGEVQTFGKELAIGKQEQRVLQLALGAEGDLWVATRSGLFRMRGSAPGPLTQLAIPGVSPTASFSSLLVDGPRLWAASSEGLVLIHDGDASRAQVFGAQDGLRVSAVRYLTQLANGEVCVGYAEAIGATCLRYADRRVTVVKHFDVTSGLSSGKVYFLGEDRWRRLWIGTGDGVDVFSERDVEHFSERDGLAGNDSAANAFFSDRDGSLWMGAVGGASHVWAAEYHGPLLPPHSVIRGGKLGEQRVAEGSLGRGAAALETPHDHSALTLDLGSDSLADPDRIDLQFRLLPLEQEWSATPQRQVRYPALIPGSYRAEVRARIDHGAWGEVTALRFTVRSAWWQKGWFFALVIALFLTLLGALFSWRQRAALTQRTRQLDEKASAKLRALLDSVPDLLIVHREDRIIYMNRAVQDMLGVDLMLGTAAQLRARIHPQDLNAVVESAMGARMFSADSPPATIEVRVRAIDESWRTLELTSVLVDFGGERAIVAAARDVTERHRLRAKLEVSDRMASLGTLAAGIAHEINNPLTYVIGNLEMVEEALTPSGDRDVLDALADAADGAERVRKIVLGLRSFSRSEEEKRAAIDPRDALQAAIRLTANEVRHRARLVAELRDVPDVIADDGQLTQVFINLIVNASHAIAAGKSDENCITVRTRTDEQGRAVIEVSDTGKGMSPEVMAWVFDPFFTTKAIGEGTGLGLSICHGIIEGLGGQIHLDSAPGVGTTVRVSVPPAPRDDGEERAAARPQLAAVAAVAQPRRVLVIDDEPLVAEMLCRALRREHTVAVDSSGRDALQRILRHERYDAILSDVMMPNMTGIELYEELLRAVPEQARRMIFVSGGVFSAQIRARMEELGLPQLAKPIDAEELRARVNEVAGRPWAAGDEADNGADARAAI